jgi:histidinol-phosphate aminotransferase
LKKIGVKYVKSAANFILFTTFPLAGKNVFAELLKEGVIVRVMDEYELIDWGRVTIGLHKENKLFIAKLTKILKS